MKIRLFILFLIAVSGLNAQTALQNTGNLRIHENGQIGFHTDLVNNGVFDENQGLAGFYGESLISISGAFFPSFFDAEFVTADGIALNTKVNILNNANFISGDVITQRNESGLALNFQNVAFSTGESDISKVNGYASMAGQQNFIFPVGDFEQLRPLVLNSEAENVTSNCAYFFENPNTPSTFDTGFDTNCKNQ